MPGLSGFVRFESGKDRFFDFVGYRIEEESFLFMKTGPICPGEWGSAVQERENSQFVSHCTWSNSADSC